ncbi:MAG TPA: hypothetical protein VFA26_01585 [Gemmataceae bacterium]|nr:hypothetical protein [Gemmataceae bacterium]
MAPGVNPRVPKNGSEIRGKLLVTSKGDKQVRKTTCKLVPQRTTGRGDDKEHVLGQCTDG